MLAMGAALSRRSPRRARADRSLALSTAAALARLWAYAIFVASLDQALAAGVVYVLLSPDTQISFHQFLGVYVIAAPISLLSLVPGGLGIFETMVVALVPSTSKAALLDSLIAYRLIYFVRLLSILTRGAKRDPGHRPR